MSFGALNINMTLQISNKILFEKPFGDTLITLQPCYNYKNKELVSFELQLIWQDFYRTAICISGLLLIGK